MINCAMTTIVVKMREISAIASANIIVLVKQHQQHYRLYHYYYIIVITFISSSHLSLSNCCQVNGKR